MELWYDHMLHTMDTILGIIDELEALEERYITETNIPSLDESAKICEDYLANIRQARDEYIRTQKEFFEIMPMLWQLLEEHNQVELKDQFRGVMNDIRNDLFWFVKKEPEIHEKLTSLCERNTDHWSSFQSTMVDELGEVYIHIRNGGEFIGNIIGEVAPDTEN